MAADLAARAHALLEANTQTAELDGRRFHFTVPSVRAYPFQWFWDSCFHAVVWARLDWRRAAAELAGLFARQEPSGSIPHVVFWNRQRVSPFTWHYLESRGPGNGIPFSRPPAQTAGIQPPVIALAAERVVLAGGGDAYAHEVVPALERYFRFLSTARDPDGDGLISIISQFEGGLDFSPAYDGRLARASGDPASIFLGPRIRQFANKLAGFDLELIFRRFHHHAEDVLVNSIYGQGLRALARLASRIRRGDVAAWAETRAERVTAALLERCYDERRGLFRNLVGADEQPTSARAIQSLMPLLLPDLPREVADSLVDHLTNPAEFWPRYPVPLVALDEPAFTPDNRVWGRRLISRGASTMCVNWFLVHGLRGHGYDDVAGTLAQHSRDLIERGGFNEFFDPRTGRPVGADRFGWATLVVDL